MAERMRIHAIKNAPHEGPGRIAAWAHARSHEVAVTRAYECGDMPHLDSFDWLVVMGGPMSVHETDAYPWLRQEVTLIEGALAHRKIILGICLGAQLIARILGARVHRENPTERGWHRIKKTEEARRSFSFRKMPREFTAFAWHTDAFDLPAGARPLAMSDACDHHAFEYDGRVVGLQFHLEVDPESIADVIDRSGYRNASGPYIQTREEIFSHIEYADGLPPLMDTLLEDIETQKD
jgi:GMP synthase-like glutamine amidotransferase